MNYFSFGSYKYRYVFETAKLTKNLYLANIWPAKNRKYCFPIEKLAALLICAPVLLLLTEI